MKYALIIILAVLLLCSCTPEGKPQEPVDQPQSDIEVVKEEEPIINPYIYSAYIVSSDGFSVNPAEICVGESTFGTDEDLAVLQNFFQNLVLSDIYVFNVAVAPTNVDFDKNFTEEQTVNLLTKFKSFEIELLPESEWENIRTGGGWEVYIETPEVQYYFVYNGLWFTAANSETRHSITFMCKDDLGFKEDILETLA